MSVIEPQAPYAVIAGFGLPGRAVADFCSRMGIPFTVIELNPQIVQRVAQTGTSIIAGDVCDEAVLRRAGIERATLFVVAIPVEAAAIEAVGIARRLNAHMRIIARCAYCSTGIEAMRRGANQVIVAEQLAAQEFSRLLGDEQQ